MHKAQSHRTIIDGVEAITLTSDRTFPRHSHDEFGFGFIAAGGQDSWSGRGIVEGGAGDVITVNPAELHDGIGRTGEPRQWHMLFLSPDTFDDLADQSLTFPEFHLPVVRSQETMKIVAAAIDAAVSAYAEAQHVKEMIMLALAALLDDRRLDSADQRVRTPHEIEKVLDLIHQQYEDPLSLEDFARLAGMSRFNFLRRFSRQVGTTPHAYLMQYRVKCAKRMIQNGAGLADAAIACGFFDQSHLTRAFARQFGVTPGVYLPA